MAKLNSPTLIKVRGYHLDYYGHVNNARYLEFLEEARWSHFENRLDLKRWRTEGFIFLVVRIDINFRRAVTLGDTLEIQTRISRFGHKSAALQQTILLKGSQTVAADAEVTFVIADADSGQALPLEGELRVLLEKV